MERIAGLRDSDIEDTLQWCAKFGVAIPFSAARADFVHRLLEVRRSALAAAIGI